MFVYGWSVLGLRFGLLILPFYPLTFFVLREENNSKIKRELTNKALKQWSTDKVSCISHSCADSFNSARARILFKNFIN